MSARADVPGQCRQAGRLALAAVAVIRTCRVLLFTKKYHRMNNMYTEDHCRHSIPPRTAGAKLVSTPAIIECCRVLSWFPVIAALLS